ncbi:hypothetical protein [Puia dinghuensis]|uniref:WG repeat-containing protein n=1 Tax=Puia dinghuensis TaxID=1792502 RepID=A0A8J2XXR4_9BACT|nr:hypothetical protein [Puia dinghuensis]GGB24635.1 hypothetical protein GCM10011511_55720 [Puia dinghuensis]
MLRPALVFISLLFASSLQAQTKIFKEVGEDISTEMKPITQDNALVGYLAFTQLERANADSFNYRVTIMDENLNDIGKVDFRQEMLDLQAVSFEQNVLCLGYIQSPLKGVQPVKTYKDLRKARDVAGSSHILLQFINLSGQIINTSYKEVNLSTETFATRSYFPTMKLVSYLKYGMQIRNIPNSGFAFFYGDEVKQQLMVFDSRGVPTHELDIPMVADHFILRATATEIYLLAKHNVGAPEGGYKLFVYSAKDLYAENNFDLRDANDNWLKVLSFDNDPATGDAFIAGCIINPRMEKQFLNAFDYANGPYVGLFTLDLGNPHKEMHANCSYWDNNTIPGLSAEGLFLDQSFFVKYASAFRDYNGNTIFAGTALRLEGVAKFRLAEGVFVRQEASGNIALDNTIPCDETKSFGANGILYQLDKKDYYKVIDRDTKTNYMIIDDQDNIYIYNVNGKKVVRTIPHKDGNVKINVYPAKEGHMMVSEYNRKEKFTRFSIEAL